MHVKWSVRSWHLNHVRNRRTSFASRVNLKVPGWFSHLNALLNRKLLMFLLCLSERSGGNSTFINSIINLYLGSSQIIDCHQPIPLFLQYWTDFRLSWNKTEYEGISQLILNPERAWLPDVMLINRSESYNFLANIICLANLVEFQIKSALLISCWLEIFRKQ